MYAGRSMARASTVTILKIVLPLVGLSLLPLAGLVYAASASFGPKTKASSSASASSAKRAPKPADDLDGPESDGDAADRTPAKPPTAAKPTGVGRAVGNSKAAQQTFCCEKLSDMARSASPQDKATLSAAASACSASPSWEGAQKQIAAVIDGAMELPNECQHR